jgi:hypothetical protein
MTRIEANDLLDEHKYGIKAHSIVEVTKALWVTNDLRGLPIHTRPFSEDGIAEWMESTRMVQSTGTGTASIGNIQGNQSGIDTNNESTK